MRCPIAGAYLQGADISYYVSFLVAGACYLALERPHAAARRATTRATAA